MQVVVWLLLTVRFPFYLSIPASVKKTGGMSHSPAQGCRAGGAAVEQSRGPFINRCTCKALHIPVVQANEYDRCVCARHPELACSAFVVGVRAGVCTCACVTSTREDFMLQ